MEQLPDARLAATYQVEGVIQASETTAVLRARHRTTGEQVVAKVLRLQGAGLEEIHRVRFLKAVGALLQRMPAGVPPLKDATWGEEAAVLVFQKVPGERMTQLEQLALPQLVYLLGQAAKSLHTLHQAGVAHLNLAPENLLVASPERVLLAGLGWGLLRLPSSGRAYAAPELRKALDLAEPQRCDLFSLGQLAAEFLGAAVRFEEEVAHVSLPEVVSSSLAAPGELELTLGRCLHLDPFERPASAADVAEVLFASVPEPTWQTSETVQISQEALSLPQPQEVAPPAAGSAPPGVAAPVPEEAAPAPPSERPVEVKEEESPFLPQEAVSQPPAPSEKAEPTVPSAAPPPPPVLVGKAPQASPAPTAGAKGRLRRVGLWAGLLAAGLVALAVFGFWLRREGVEAPLPAPVPTATVSPHITPTPFLTPTPAVPSWLAQLRRLEEERQWEALRAALKEAREQPEAAAHAEELQGMAQKLALADRNQALSQLERALATGDLVGLRRALRVIDAAPLGEEGLSPEQQQLLAKGRTVRQLWNKLTREEQGARWEGVLSTARELERAMPGLKETAVAQEKAASALEREAQRAEAQGDLGRALQVLTTLERFLPARAGLGERIAGLRRKQARQAQLQQVLERAAQLGRAGKPEQGLQLLGELPGEEAQLPQVTHLRQELAERLAALDAQPPAVSPPAPGHKWEYAKGQLAKVEVKASDDHGVARVTLFLRKKGTQDFRSLPMVKTSTGTYVAEIAPATHSNEDLEFYVLVEDHSGHQGLLGSPQRPLEAKRKRGLFGF